MSVISFKETSQVVAYKKIQERTCLVRTLTGKATGFFVSEDGVIATVSHVLTQLKIGLSSEATLSSKLISIEYKGEIYSVEFKKEISSLNQKILDALDLCFLKITRPIVTPYFSELHNGDLDMGTEVFFAGYPPESKEPNVFKGTVASIYLDENQIQRFNVDGNVQAGFSGGPIVHMHQETLYLVGMLYAMGTESFDEFVQHSEVLDSLNNPRNAGITWVSQCQVHQTQHRFTLMDLWKENNRFFLRNLSTGLGKALSSKYVLEMLNPKENYSSSFKNNTSLKKEMTLASTVIAPKLASTKNVLEISEDEKSLLELLNFVKIHAKNSEVLQTIEGSSALFLKKEGKNHAKALEDCKKIKKLDFSEKHLTSLPSNISVFSNLTYLDLTNNDFSEFPVEVMKLNQLKILNLTGNQIEKLPSDLGSKLTALNVLKILQNPIKEVPSNLSEAVRDLPYTAKWV